MINFKTTKENSELIMKIVERAESLGVQRNGFELLMDITATHNKYSLRLKDFLEADDFNFIHDIAGITKHLNRKTGELEDNFLPRFAN